MTNGLTQIIFITHQKHIQWDGGLKRSDESCCIYWTLRQNPEGCVQERANWWECLTVQYNLYLCKERTFVRVTETALQRRGFNSVEMCAAAVVCLSFWHLSVAAVWLRLLSWSLPCSAGLWGSFKSFVCLYSCDLLFHSILWTISQLTAAGVIGINLKLEAMKLKQSKQPISLGFLAWLD